jgi:hypothetical protein
VNFLHNAGWSDAEILCHDACTLKRERRAARNLNLPFVPITPTETAGRSFRRAAERKELKRKLDGIPSQTNATAARERHAESKGRVRRRRTPARRQVTQEPEEQLTRGEKKQIARETASLKEFTRQQGAADAIIKRGGGTRAQIYSRFGSLAGLI